MSDTRGERLPVVRDAGGEEDGGRGLALVAALAEEWGVAGRPGAPGKTVWAVVATAPMSSPGSPAPPPVAAILTAADGEWPPFR